MKALLVGTITAACWLTGFYIWLCPAQPVHTPDSNNAKFVSMPAADTVRLDGKWFLQPVLPSDTATGKVPYIGFDVKKNRFSGNTGCNNMSGRFTLSGKTLRFDSNMITTKMVCTGYNEAAFIKSLLHTNGYKFDNGVLVLLFDGTELSRWSRSLPRPRINRA
jgi:heat shock protein HslJ